MAPRNIVFTGIMGCGKTTIGKMAAERLQMQFLDLDQIIETRWGSIPSIFEKGEEYFRDIEGQVVSEVSEMEGVVIATGGGVIKREENIHNLKKKGIVFFIDRPLEDILSDIETSHRPLLKGGREKLAEIFQERYAKYISTCDVHLREAKNPEAAVRFVTDYWTELISRGRGK